VFATNRARRDAAAIMPGTPIERAVEALVLEGRLVRDHPGGRGAWLVLGDGWLARVAKCPSPVGTGSYWSVRAVEPRPVPLRGTRPTLSTRAARPQRKDAHGVAPAAERAAPIALETRIEQLLARWE
jgi:hypothetical protein